MTRLLLAVAALFVVSCGPMQTEGDYLYLKRAGAKMPIWVKGNIESGTFLVTIHGGPGDAGHEFPLSEGFAELEKDYAIVYWDQRASGMSQGNPDPSTFTVENFVLDTDAVISVIQQKYSPDRMFLYGHSWGGDLAIAYMADGVHKDEFDGWVAHGAAHDERFATQEVYKWVFRRIDEVIAEGKDVEYWEEARAWLVEHPNLPPSDPRPFIYAGSLGAYYYDAESYEPPPMGELIFLSPFSMAFYENNQQSYRLKKMLDDFDYTNRLSEMDTRALVMVGRHDGAVPVPVSEAIFEGLGATDKELVIHEDVAHSVHYEDPPAFVRSMKRFIDSP